MNTNIYIRATKYANTMQYAGFLEIDGCIEIQTFEEISITEAVKSLNNQIKLRRIGVSPVSEKGIKLIDITKRKLAIKSPPKKRGRKQKEMAHDKLQ